MRLRPCTLALGASERMNSTQPQPRKLTIDAAPLLFWPLLIVRTIALALCSFVSSIYCTHIVHMNGTKGTNTKLYFRFIQVILYNVDWTGAYKHITVCLFKSCHSFPFWYQQSVTVYRWYSVYTVYTDTGPSILVRIIATLPQHQTSSVSCVGHLGLGWQSWWRKVA